MIKVSFSLSVFVTAVHVASAAGSGAFGSAPDGVEVWRLPVPLLREARMLPGRGMGETGTRFERVKGPFEGETWLGVQVAPVPPALAAHLPSRHEALMVCNVFRGSPADRAGLERYDVILEVDGEPIEGGIAGFAKYIRGKEPGDMLALTIYHRGETRPVEVELAHRPAGWDRLEPKYREEPPGGGAKDFNFRGKIFRFGPGGWKLEDLGEIPELRGLYHYYAHPPADFGLGEEEVDEVRRVDAQGRWLHIRRHEDGSIMVERGRTGDGARATEVRTYRSEEELREADPEAYDLLQSTRPHRDLSESARNAVRRYREALRHYQEALRDYVDAMRREHGKRGWPGPFADDRWREWSRRFFRGPLEGLGDPEGIHRFRPDEPKRVEPEPGPTTEFEVGPGGEITVHVTDQDRRLSRTFASEAEFKAKAPELYAQFEQLQSRVR